MNAKRGQAVVETTLFLLVFITVLIFAIHFAEIGYLTQLIENVRRLVEVDRVAVVIAPLVGNAEGLVLRELAHRYPRTVFIVGYSGAPETTLRDPAPNFFRFTTDGAQWQKFKTLAHPSSSAHLCEPVLRRIAA